MIKVIILDFDGVIVESLDIKTQAFRDLFSNYPEHIDEIMNYQLEYNPFSRYIKFEHIVTNILNYSHSMMMILPFQNTIKLCVIYLMAGDLLIYSIS